MTSMQIDQRLTHDQSKPDENGTRRIGEEVLNAVHCSQPCFLQYVIGIDPAM